MQHCQCVTLCPPSYPNYYPQRLSCEQFEGGVSLLSADFRVDCHSSRYQQMLAVAGIMTVIFPIGVPLFLLWTLRLWRKRHQLYPRNKNSSLVAYSVDPDKEESEPRRRSRFSAVLSPTAIVPMDNTQQTAGIVRLYVSADAIKPKYMPDLDAKVRLRCKQNPCLHSVLRLSTVTCSATTQTTKVTFWGLPPSCSPRCFGRTVSVLRISLAMEACLVPSSCALRGTMACTRPFLWRSLLHVAQVGALAHAGSTPGAQHKSVGPPTPPARHNVSTVEELPLVVQKYFTDSRSSETPFNPADVFYYVSLLC